MSRRRKRKLEQGLKLATGAAMVGLGASCDEGTRVCDPPPPPLCDSLDLDPLLSLRADPTQVPLDGSIQFTGIVDRTLVETIAFWVDAGAGTVSDLGGTPPDTLSFRWSPRDPDGGFRPGMHDLVVWLELRPRIGSSSAERCDDPDTVTVEIDANGNATVLSLPGAQPMSVYFRTALEVTEVDGGYRLVASTSLPRDARRGLTWSWRSSAGTLVPDRDTARYVPDPGGAPAVVQVEARLGERGLAVATWAWSPRR